MGQYLANTRHWQAEEDTFGAQVCLRAARYAEDLASHPEPFFLWVDLFDPHEPFDAPPAYLARYWDQPLPTPGRYLFGYGVDSSKVRPEDLPLIQAAYRAEVTLVDRWIGHLLETLRVAGLYDNSLIVFTSDHGTEFNEHGVTMKHYFALYDTTIALPLLVRRPDERQRGRAVSALVSAEDFMPSWLSLLGVEPPQGQITGRDFAPLMDGSSGAIRDACLSAYDGYGAVRDLDWLYIFPLAGVGESFQEGAFDMTRFGEQLYDLRRDPGQVANVLGQHPERRRSMRARFAEAWPAAVG
jgi:arylsulfatase A-like enzyme